MSLIDAFSATKLHRASGSLEIVMPTTRLYFTASVEEQWRTLVEPWLREQAVTAWKNPKPTVVLTPSRAESFYLRSRLVEEGVSYLGLRFWTPSDTRKFLLAEIAPEIGVATQAELRLIARACAERLAQPAGLDHATLNSVIREPAPFLRAYDLLLGAGWDPAREGADYGRELARALQQELKKSRLATQAGLHRELRHKAASRRESLLARLLVVGFNATHWPLWDLLQAAVLSSEEASIALAEPRFFAQEIDQLWTGSWEEITQSEAVAPSGASQADDAAAPFSTLVASYEKGAPGPSDAADLSFLVTPDLATHVRAVVLQALDYLRRDSCTRLGIIFPEANALALGVAEELRRLGLPLDDGTGAPAPGLFEKRCWQSWLALQEEPGAPALIAWMRACEAQGVSFGAEKPLTARSVADVVEGVLGEALVDDLILISRHLEENSRDPQQGRVADFLRRRIALPAEATFSGFLALTRQALALPGWEDHLARLQIDPPAWLFENNAPFSRRTFLEWLKESTNSQTRARDAESNHFYGKVHLVIYAQMTGQTWSHLILTGLNEGVWPRLFAAGAFGSRHELTALNQKARELNRRGLKQGGQGMGHETVHIDHGYCLLPLEQQDLGLRDLCSALESTSAAACLTAMTTEGGRSLLPSDFFNHAYQAQTGRVLDEETFRKLGATTEAWCRRHEFLFESSKSRRSSREIAATRTAYAARRDPAQPFGPYEFSFAQPPIEPIQLSCKRWQDAWNHPGTVWLEEIVGASPWPEGALSWPRTVGTWAHSWLAAGLRDRREHEHFPGELSVFVWAAADREAHRVRRLAQEAALELYPWWEQVWAQARTVALGLAETLEPNLSGRQILTEYSLPQDMIALPGTPQADFQLKGRIDLLLVEPGTSPRPFIGGNPDPGDFSGCACWVVDFKTGSAQSLNAKRMGEGKGLQALLYALAIQARGASSLAISLHTPDVFLTPQVQLDGLTGIASLYQSLDKFHREGIFGMRADAGNDYAYSPAYPMATRFVPSHILEAKWALVHGTASESAEEPE